MDKKAARIRRATRARRKLQELGATRLVVHRTPSPYLCAGYCTKRF